jgi:RNA polymerase sigma factor (sigma-70 family)
VSSSTRGPRNEAGNTVVGLSPPPLDDLAQRLTTSLVAMIQHDGLAHDAKAELARRYIGRAQQWHALQRKGGEHYADAIQDAWINIIKGLNQYTPDRGSFWAWCKAIVANASITCMRKLQRQHRAENAPELQQHQAQREEAFSGDVDVMIDHLFLQECLERIRRDSNVSDKTIEAYRLRVVEKRSRKEAAAALGLSVKEIDVAVSRIRTRLKQEWQRLDRQGPDRLPPQVTP